MTLTNALRKQITAAVRRNVKGANPGARVGFRTDAKSNNALTWGPDDDLWDAWPIASVRTLDDDPLNPGCYVLDLYVTTGIGPYRELETNVYVAIKDGQVVLATSHDLKVGNMLRAIGFPTGRGWLVET